MAGELYPIDTSHRLPAFRSLDGPIWEGHTVTYVALQIAFYMGFEKVVLLGIDHDYGQVYQPNIEVVSTAEDQAHFDESYFGPGIRWHAPDLQMSEVAYSLARKAYEAAGRQIINASAHSKLNAFPLLPYNHVMHPTKRVSAIVSAYYAEEFILECITDLLKQTEQPEIVVVCKRGSVEHMIAQQFTCAECTIVATEDVPTVYAAWNLGLLAAHGRYLTNANTDDRHHPEAYRIMADVLDARPEIDLVYHDQYVTWKPNQTYEDYWKENQGVELVTGRWEGKPGVFCWPDYERRTLRQGCYIGPQPMWRANLHQRYGLFEAQYRSAGDYEFWLRCAGEHNYLHIPYPLGLYLARPNGIELGDPVTSQEETNSALYLGQNTEAELMYLGNDFFRFNLGDNYVAVTRQNIKDWEEWAERKSSGAPIRLQMP
jgi:glycosyltransferase involved in cell wall biosynthesis